MKMNMTITKISNIDYTKRKVIDNDKIQQYSLDWEDTIEVFNTYENKKEFIKVKDVSLYNHTLLMLNDKWQILHALSKQ